MQNKDLGLLNPEEEIDEENVDSPPMLPEFLMPEPEPHNMSITSDTSDGSDDNIRNQSFEDDLDVQEIGSPPHLQLPLSPPEHILGEDEVTDDPLKSDASITFRICNFSIMLRRSMDMESRWLSGATYSSGGKWRIMVFPEDEPMTSGWRLAVFVKCDGFPEQSKWSCWIGASIKVIGSHDGRLVERERFIDHVLSDTEGDWGYRNFANLNILMDKDNGFYRKELDELTLEAHISTELAQIDDAGRPFFGYFGLVNKGTTCYLNAILQVLYHCHKLRQDLFDVTIPKFPAMDMTTLRALRIVFYDLQHTREAVDPINLINALKLCVYIQQDAHEIMLRLLDYLENALRNTQQANVISELFQGKMRCFIKCTEIDYESSREETFLDVQLPITKRDVLSAFREYIEPESMDGDNKYAAGEHGLQPALKGVQFLHFPPVLNVQLMRFEMMTMSNGTYDYGKLNNHFEFPARLDLNEFVDSDDNIYVLQSIIAHSGTLSSGHYVAFVNANLSGDPKWYKFDDDNAIRVHERTAVRENFGGADNNQNAYMLVYVKESAIETVVNKM